MIFDNSPSPYGLTKKAKTILRKVAKHILAEPKRLNMSDWIKRKRNAKKQRDGFAKGVGYYPYAKCGTAGCIAGWVVLLHDGLKAKQVEFVGKRAEKLLELDDTPTDLFYVDTWDEPYSQEYMDATSETEKAKVAAAYIKHYIKTRGQNEISARFNAAINKLTAKKST